ncbi:MAG: hypothetical protein HYX36_11675 [Rhizobiales bacterium]|nr:hypothetical protein [Hyphomicrobiales bacterium]
MVEGLDKSLSKIFLACLDYYQSNRDGGEKSQLRAVLAKGLTKTLSTAARLHEPFFAGWTADRDHPGYLMKFDPPMMVRVPFHVLPVFLERDQLGDIWALSRRIRTSSESTICLGGSNVIRSIFGDVGDVDFCEYIPLHSPITTRRFTEAISGTEDIVCLSINLGKEEWLLPSNQERPTIEQFETALLRNHSQGANVKINYITSAPSFGVLEATDKIIAIDHQGKSAALVQTFAAQEAPLVPIDWLPNQMNDPFELGRYIHWLIGAIGELKAGGELLKCTKRCASLSRILFLPDHTNAITHLLSSYKAVEEAALLEHSESLRMRISDSSDPRVANLLTNIDSQIARCRSNRSSTNSSSPATSFVIEAETVIEDLLRVVKM